MTGPKPWGEDVVLDPKDARILALEADIHVMREAIGLLMGGCDVVRLSPALVIKPITVVKNESGIVISRQ